MSEAANATKLFTGSQVKLPGNRRVYVGQCKEDDSWCLEFKRLGDKSLGEDRVETTRIRISNEAMDAVIELHQQLLEPKARAFKVKLIISDDGISLDKWKEELAGG